MVCRVLRAGSAQHWEQSLEHDSLKPYLQTLQSFMARKRSSREATLGTSSPKALPLYPTEFYGPEALNSGSNPWKIIHDSFEDPQFYACMVRETPSFSLLSLQVLEGP